ncbi:MAG: D-Ala-D-Ala carboxypeptidase family metallohydrolase [Pseudomonadota bacterium]|nr:D-Ala-D-Ala carboxypeptidase family metallohydrolase [Pseudomonadota bacterium]
MRIQLSNNFYLDEFTYSQTAVRHGIKIEVPENSIQFLRLKALCTTVLQPLRDHLGRPITITSGYRPEEVNRLIGGSSNSQHIQCLAGDYVVPGMDTIDVCRAVIALKLPFDQLINEFGRWVHVSIAANPGQERGEVLTAYKFRPVVGSPRTRYEPGLHLADQLEASA